MAIFTSEGWILYFLRNSYMKKSEFVPGRVARRLPRTSWGFKMP